MKMESFGSLSSGNFETRKNHLKSGLISYQVRSAAIELFLEAHQKSQSGRSTPPEKATYGLIKAVCLLVMSQVVKD
jgi:hypothetical protein